MEIHWFKMHIKILFCDGGPIYFEDHNAIMFFSFNSQQKHGIINV